MGTRKYYGREQWKEWILECRESGMMISEWCDMKGLNANRFHKWKKKLLSDGTIDCFPSHSGRVAPQETASTPVQLPTIVQVNLDCVRPDNTDRTACMELRGTGHIPQACLDSQVMFETPGRGYRVFIGNSFNQETLKRLLEVVQ